MAVKVSYKVKGIRNFKKMAPKQLTKLLCEERFTYALPSTQHNCYFSGFAWPLNDAGHPA